MIEKYYNENGEIGVLVSYGYGAGWSTWYDDLDLALDKRIIEKFLELSSKDIEYKVAEKEMKDYLENLGYKNVFCGGLEGLTLEYVSPGTPIKINEYDGAKSLEEGYSEFTII